MPEDCGVHNCFARRPICKRSSVRIGSVEGLRSISNCMSTLYLFLMGLDKKGSEETKPEPKIPRELPPTLTKKALSPFRTFLWLVQCHSSSTFLACCNNSFASEIS